MTRSTRWISLSILGLALTSTLVAARSVDAITERTGDRIDGRHTDRSTHDTHRRHERRARFHERIAQRMGWSDAQRALALQEARAAQPIANHARQERKRILDETRAALRRDDSVAVRDAARAQLHALRESSRRELEPLARTLAASLTPAQRHMLEGRAAKHGRTFDEDRLVRRIGRMLARPRCVERLEARVGR